MGLGLVRAATRSCADWAVVGSSLAPVWSLACSSLAPVPSLACSIPALVRWLTYLHRGKIVLSGRRLELLQERLLDLLAVVVHIGFRLRVANGTIITNYDGQVGPRRKLPESSEAGHVTTAVVADSASVAITCRRLAMTAAFKGGPGPHPTTSGLRTLIHTT